MDDLKELNELLNQVTYENPEPKQKVLAVTDQRGKPVDLREIRKRATNPDIVGMTPAQRRRQLGLRKSPFKNLIKPKGYIESGAGVLDLEKLKNAKDNVKELVKREIVDKFYRSDESPYYKWFVLHHVGIDLGDHSLEREYAKKAQLPLWRFMRSAYGRTESTRKVLGKIVKHLKIPYFTREYKKIGKVKTDIDFAEEVKRVEYTLTEEEKAMKRKSMTDLEEVRKEERIQMKEWMKKYGNPILRAYWNYMGNNNLEQYNKDMGKMINQTDEDKVRFQQRKLYKLFYDYPSWMPEEYKPDEPRKRQREDEDEDEDEEPEPKRVRASVFYDSDDEEDDIPDFIVYNI